MSTESNMDGPDLRPIAIVGMSCRLSGDVSTLDDFWTMLSRSRDGWRPVPEDRFSSKAFYHPDPQKKGSFNCQGGYFMNHDLSRFDAPFFGITEQEALAMDPQQRLLLECAYEALENAGFPKESVAGSNMGVFVGGTSSDYRLGTLRELNQTPAFDATGNHQSIQAGRISYFFDIRGPSLAIDTACSSGLHALHAAVQSIRCGEADSAIVAGCSLHLQPHDMASMASLGLFNEHGKTFAFDHRATSGFARGEGVACLVLKPLDRALSDNDRIRSVIVNTGVNQDGKTNGLTKPSVEAQERLARDVYSRAKISPEETGFVESHGTGTRTGDPIEAKSIYRVFGVGRTKRAPLYIGSVKSNIGHLENASGIISVIKASLMLERGFILPNVNYEKPIPAIPLDRWNIKVPTTIRPWPKSKKYISINSFGFGGSNAHAVLERAPPPACVFDELPMEAQNQAPRLFVLSAHDEGAAKRVGSQLGFYVEQHPEVFQKRLIRDVAHTLGSRRSQLPWRIAVIAASMDELAQALNGVNASPARASKVPRLAFVYNGQGAQWAGMGKELMQTHPVFAATLTACNDFLKHLGADFSLLDELEKPEGLSLVNQARISQPLCTALQLALTTLLASWGVKPSLVTGHSSGEIAAAYALGAVSLEDAMMIAYYRGWYAHRIMERFPKLRGAMLAVGLGAEETRHIVQTMGRGNVALACENSPVSSTISGEECCVDAIAAELRRRGIFNVKLRVNVAYHSPQVGLTVRDYRLAIQPLQARTTTWNQDVVMYSSLYGREVPNINSINTTYWVCNLVCPVRFNTALQNLCINGKPDIIIELGPHSTLKGSIKQVLKTVSHQTESIKYLPTIIRNKDATISLLKMAGQLFVNGLPLDFNAINEPKPDIQKPVVVTDFTPYPFSDHKYWFEPRASKQHRLLPFAPHDLLGSLEDRYSHLELTWRNILSTDDVPWLKGHRMQSLVTFPLAGYICMAVEAAFQKKQLGGVPFDRLVGFRLREVQVFKALILDDGAPVETMLSLRGHAECFRSFYSDWDEFRISSWTQARGWLEHCRGLVATKKDKRSVANPVNNRPLHGPAARRHHARASEGRDLSINAFYRELNVQGACYTDVFKLPSDSGLKVSGQYCSGIVTIPNTTSDVQSRCQSSSIVPATLVDLLSQHTFAILGAGRGHLPSLFMPSAAKEVEIALNTPNTAGERVEVIAHGCPDPNNPGPVDFCFDAWYRDEAEPVIKVSGFRMTPIESGIQGGLDAPSLCYEVQWERLDRRASDGDGFDIESGELADDHHGDCDAGSMSSDCKMTEIVKTISRAHSAETSGNVDESSIVIISDRKRNDPLVSALADLIGVRTPVWSIILPLGLVEASPTTRYICLVELDGPGFLRNMSVETFANVQRLLLQSRSVLWVTVGAYRFANRPENNISQGLLRAIRSETNKAATFLDLDPHSQLRVRAKAELILRAMKCSIHCSNGGSPVDFEFAEEDGELVVPRVVNQEDMNSVISRETNARAPPYLQDFEQPGRRLKVAIGCHGALDSIFWKDEAQRPLGHDEVEIQVVCTGVNFKDVVIAMAQMASPYLGIECSGIIVGVGVDVASLKLGDRVCAMSLGAYSTYARCPATSAVVIPDDMSFEVAASIPVAYSTAFYGLMGLARLEPGEKVLIHSAAGGVGQAAIQLSQMVGAEIYATVGSAEKKRLLIDTYGVRESRIFYSRDNSFSTAIREATDGEGVDVVLNSLAGELLRESWDCVAPFGRFIELGKRDIASNSRLEMAKFDCNCSFNSVDMALVASAQPKTMSRALAAVMDLMRAEVIRPIEPIITVGMADVEASLRKLQSGKTTGKLVVKHIGADQVKVVHPPTPVALLRADATYIVIGGTGGLGRSIVRRMVQRGARRLVLLSRHGRTTDVLDELVKESQAVGTSIDVLACDVSNESQVNDLVQCLESSASLPPIRGIIHAAMDVLFEEMTLNDYNTVVASKISGAWNFHNALLKAPLDFFVVLSSVAGIVGNKGQAAYSAANTFLDALVRHRKRLGLPASSLDLAAVEGVGHLAENGDKRAQVNRSLAISMNETELLALVEAAMRGKVEGQVITGLGSDSAERLPFYASDARFSALLTKVHVPSPSELPTWSQKLRLATMAKDVVDAVMMGLGEKLGAILMLPAEEMRSLRGGTLITTLGLDSLNAIELRNWISKEFQSHLQVLELLSAGRLEDLASLVVRKSTLPLNKE